jgi:nitrogen fixation protein NifZ
VKTRWDYGDAVRVLRNVRDDGTFPGADVGELLIQRGSVGHVIDFGTFLMDQVIYSVHFVDVDRVIGCREEELIGAEEPWVPSLFETRQRVVTRIALGKGDEVLVPMGGSGEILKVVRDAPGGVAYHVHFDCLKGRLLQVSETSLEATITEREHA